MQPRLARETPSASTHSNTLPSSSFTLPPLPPSSMHPTTPTHTPLPYSSPTTLPPRHGSKKGPRNLPRGLMINNPVGINADRISTTDNVIANCISRFPNHANPLPHFLPFSQQFLQLHHCRRFHPSAELVSTILDALSLAKSPDPRDPKLQNLSGQARTLSCLLPQQAHQQPVPRFVYPCSPELLPRLLCRLPHPRENHQLHHRPSEHDQKLQPRGLQPLHQQRTTITTLFEN